MLIRIILCLGIIKFSYSANNGLARLPPMGWMSWTKFYCQLDCIRYPNSCINADLYKAHADRIVEDGYLAAGYYFVHIDDCWLESDRDTNGQLVANKTRFPDGISGLADYIHTKGLKLGLYECVGLKTCREYPGSYGYEEVDAQTFANWGVDYLKYDGCYSNDTIRIEGFPKMYNSLVGSGREIVFSTAWWGSDQGNLTGVSQVSNLQRHFNDITRSFESILNITDHFVQNQDLFVNLPTGPGFWIDPDMIIVGNDWITIDQAKAQMTIWSIWSAPLIMSNDLRNLTAGHKEILQNKYVIAVDQDPLGMFGKMPSSFVLNEIGLTNPSGYTVMDLWAGKIIGTYWPNSTYSAIVNATGVNFIKATVLQ